MRIEKVDSKQKLKLFIKFPFKLYENNEFWVPPLITEQKKFLNKEKNPYFQHSDAQLFIAYKNDKIVGRISAQTNTQHNKTHNDKVGFFGFFESVNDQEVADKLLQTAENWLKERGLDTMRGPANFSVNDECGLLIDGFDSSPLILMTYNPPYYKKLLNNYGLIKSMDLYAYSIPVQPPPERLQRLATKIEKRGKFTVRALKTKNKKKLREDLEKIFEIYEKAWEDNWGYVPMSPAEFDMLVDNLLPIVKPEFILIAEVDNKAVGITVTLPDYNYVIKKMKGKMLPIGFLKFLYYQNKIPGLRVVIMGVLDEYKNRGIDVVMYCKSFETASQHKIPYEYAEFSWVLETNTMMNKISKTLEAEIYKTYQLLDKSI